MTLAALALFQLAQATHIVGGEIYYERTNPSNNVYRITLKLYVDCQNGSPRAIADDAVANIGMYDAVTNAYLGQFSMTRVGPSRIDKVNYSCVEPPSGVCVDGYTYSLLKTINPGSNGVILGFHRCCRNNSINNILAPEATGITIWTKIPPSSTTNTSAIFKDLPPNYVCLNAPLTVDHSATDADGDSLVYSLSTPYSGGTADDPKPSPSNFTRPPFGQIFWRGSYNVQNQMGGSPRLSINSSTGELTVTPSVTGQFVIGITVAEFRNGQFIGETRRDYQFNVIDCVFDILADYTVEGGVAVDGAYSFECRDTIFFKNRSTSKSTPSYFWNFGDPTTEADTSHEKDPFWVYPGNGNYTVTLKVKSSICEDEYKYEVRIRSEKPFELGPDRMYCDDIETVLNTNTPDALSVTWNSGQSGSQITVRDTGTYIANVSYGNCFYLDTIRILSDPVPSIDLPDDTLFCNEDDIDFTLDTDLPNLNYEWNSNPKSFDQQLDVTEPGTYIVTVRNLNCMARDTTRVWVATHPELNDTLYCGDFEHFVDVGDIEEATYSWSNGATTPATMYNFNGVHWLTVKQRHCVFTDTFRISNPNIAFDLGGDRHFCDEVFAELDAGPDGLTYTWSTGETSRLISATRPDTYTVFVTDRYGCTRLDSVTLTMTPSPLLLLGNDTTICMNTDIVLGTGEDYAAYDWNNGETTALISTKDSGLYRLIVTDKYGCQGADSLRISIDPEALPNELFVPNAFTPNYDDLNDLFPYSIDVLQPEYMIMIFNRWGEKVFDSRTSDNVNWDGTYKGERVNQEAFIYYMQYRGCDGFTRSRKGTVTPVY